MTYLILQSTWVPSHSFYSLQRASALRTGGDLQWSLSLQHAHSWKNTGRPCSTIRGRRLQYGLRCAVAPASGKHLLACGRCLVPWTTMSGFRWWR
jgi:hypothetical protein